MKKIYLAYLIAADGKIRRHNGCPSEMFLKKHPEYVSYRESGKQNEYFYTSVYKIEEAILIEVSDRETHERNIE
ncbi:MAG: hypothetical protein M0P47_09290 [Bacteroidales bacterium]|nr:hypothetical protein [Bacteroidales bacterium]